MKKITQKGFSLLELLVVVGIISILLAIGFSSYSTVQKKSRDATRRSNLKSIQQAMEQYYAVCGFSYPTLDPGTQAVSNSIYCADPAITQLPTPPLDPKSGNAYGCRSTCSSTTYDICATPEVEGDMCISNQQ